jgi:hypothetical protein
VYTGNRIKGSNLFLSANSSLSNSLHREVSEWLKEHAWKVCIRETVSRVRIPSSLHRPPKLQQRRAFLCPTDKNYLTQTNCNIRVVEGVPSTREKLCIRETVSRVRIPASPAKASAKAGFLLFSLTRIYPTLWL